MDFDARTISFDGTPVPSGLRVKTREDFGEFRAKASPRLNVLYIALLAAIFFLCWAVTHALEREPPNWDGIYFFVLIMVPCVLALLLIRPLVVVAYNNGIWYRRLYRSRFVPWRDVEALYVSLSGPRAGHPVWSFRSGSRIRPLAALYLSQDLVQVVVESWSRLIAVRVDDAGCYNKPLDEALETAEAVAREVMGEHFTRAALTEIRLQLKRAHAERQDSAAGAGKSRPAHAQGTRAEDTH